VVSSGTAVEEVASPGGSARAVVRQALALNAAALTAAAERIDARIDEAVRLIIEAGGRVVVSGIGKSGLIGRKISATMSSLGTPSLFLHSAEAVHGDLGQICAGDVVLLLSASGETREVVTLIPFLKRGNNPMVAITANPSSTLARHADVTLDGSIERECCPFNLAPTTSTLVALALGDALALALASARGFKPSDFAQYHPGGRLGERLLSPVREVMRRQDLPVCPSGTPVRDVLPIMTAGGLGMVLVMEGEALRGVITDGDIRRALEARGQVDDVAAEAIMTSDPITIGPDVPMYEAEMKMREARITTLLVADQAGLVLGTVQIHD
jgi:arabinose-5-phosphate isomerase